MWWLFIGDIALGSLLLALLWRKRPTDAKEWHARKMAILLTSMVLAQVAGAVVIYLLLDPR